MPETNEPELTLVAGDGVSEASITPTENENAPSAQDGSSIEGLTRLGPGNIDGLRFRWTVRRVPEGYLVDETIGASVSAFSTGPMSRDNTLAFLDAREAEARQRFESLRRKFLEAQKLATGDRNLQNVSAHNLDVQNHDAAKDSQPTENLRPEVIDAPLPDSKETKSPPLAGGINVDDVMDRIVRLLDEH